MLTRKFTTCNNTQFLWSLFYILLYDISKARWETHVIIEYQLTWCFTSSMVLFNFFNFINIYKEFRISALLFYNTNVKCNTFINVCIDHGDEKWLVHVSGQNHSLEFVETPNQLNGWNNANKKIILIILLRNSHRVHRFLLCHNYKMFPLICNSSLSF